MSTEELEDELSRPSGRDVEFLRHLEGDILILGASGKMGPSLARLCRRARPRKPFFKFSSGPDGIDHEALGPA